MIQRGLATFKRIKPIPCLLYTSNAETDYMPHKLISDISQIKNLPLQVKINRIQISPALEVIKWPGNGSLTIELDQVYPGENIEIDFGKSEIATWGSLEISANGKDWSKVNFTQEKNLLTASLQQKPIKAVRFTNMQHQEQEIYLRHCLLYTSANRRYKTQ